MEAFLDHLSSQFNLCEELKGATINNKQWIQHVSQSVLTVPKSASVETTAEMLAANTGNAFTCSDCFSLLHSTTVRRGNAPKVQGKQAVCSHEVACNDSGDCDHLNNNQWNVHQHHQFGMWLSVDAKQPAQLTDLAALLVAESALLTSGFKVDPQHR